jgi:hypothetical protein
MRRRLSRWGAALLALAPLAASAEHQGATPAQRPPIDPTLVDRTFAPTTLPPRWGEIGLGLVPVSFDWGRDGATRFGEGVLLEGALIPREAQWIRPALQLGFVYGRWSRAHTGDVTYEAGLKLRLDPGPTEPVTGYLAMHWALGASPVPDAQGGFPFTHVLGGGVGARALRTVALEVTADWIHVLGVPDPETTLSGVDRLRLQVSLHFDLCGLGLDCNASPRQTIVVDATCALMAEARAIRDASSPEQLGTMCAAVEHAMDPARYAAADGFTSGDAFLQGLVHELRPRPGQPASAAYESALQLQRKHQQIKACVTRNRDDEKKAAQRHRLLTKRYNYSPFPPLLRAALGCALPGAQAASGAAPGEPPALEVCEETRAAVACEG